MFLIRRRRVLPLSTGGSEGVSCSFSTIPRAGSGPVSYLEQVFYVSTDKEPGQSQEKWFWSGTRSLLGKKKLLISGDGDGVTMTPWHHKLSEEWNLKRETKNCCFSKLTAWLSHSEYQSWVLKDHFLVNSENKFSVFQKTGNFWKGSVSVACFLSGCDQTFRRFAIIEQKRKSIKYSDSDPIKWFSFWFFF